MKPFKSYLKSSVFLIALTSGCTTPSKPVSTLKSETKSIDIFDLFCANNKQIRKLTTSIDYIVPRLPKMALDMAAKEQARYAEKKKELLRRALFSLADGRKEPLVSQSRSTYDELIDEEKNEILESASYNTRGLIEKPIDSDEFVLLHVPIYRYENAIYRSQPTYIWKLKSLVDNFTILEPLKYQQNVYNTNSGYCYNCSQPDPLAIDKEGNQSISKAIERKDDIWLRYIEHFTRIKEAKTSDPRIIHVDFDLDLNGFCRYGRRISDLQSQ